MLTWGVCFKPAVANKHNGTGTNSGMIMSLSSLFLAASVADRTSRDEARRENEQLSAEVEGAQREYKKLKQVVEHLTRDYEASKDFDPLRRYKKMKGMVKRTVLHLRLDPDQQGSSQGIVGLVQGCKDYTLQLEGVKRRGERTNSEYTFPLLGDYLLSLCTSIG